MPLHDTPSLRARFWKHVDRTDTCWLWAGARRPDGYGQFSVASGKSFLVHRLIWEWTHGSIAAGMQVCHACDVRHCVRPDHLFLGSNAENQFDRYLKGRDKHTDTSPPVDIGNRRYGEGVKTSKLTWQQVDAIRAEYATGKSTQTALAVKHGVSQGVIGNIIHNRTWKRPKPEPER
jgi:hypothetical protein